MPLINSQVALAVALGVQGDQPRQHCLGVEMGLCLQPLLDSLHIRFEWVGLGVPCQLG
jgi:hypothetical protein